MPTSLVPQTTDFTLDVLGRYVCNGLDEALASTDTAAHADARPFDLIVLGGGSFGAVLASHLFFNDTSRTHRILVLEAGPFALPEHTQNLPPQLNPGEVWGVPWNSDSPQVWNRRFPGLAFCPGGRSLFWGGWSPYFIDSELAGWPKAVRDDLTAGGYLDTAAEQIGTAETNDFVYGPLHDTLKDRLYNGLRTRPAGTSTALVGNRGTPMTAGAPKERLLRELDAPLAVQSASPRPGFFPFNKFNGMQLLVRAARLAQTEAEQSAVGGPAERDVKKRLMLVDRTKVIRLERQGGRITRVVTNHGVVDVPATGHVFLALGTVESTRLALTALPNTHRQIGRNLMAHLRSNVTIRLPRASLGTALAGIQELAVSALFVKGVHTHTDGSLGHFHLQITASGVGAPGTDSEAELFKKIPDIDTLDRFRDLTDEWVVVTLRGIGEMTGDKTSPDPMNRITLDYLGPQDTYDYGQARALVRLEAQDPADPVGRNMALWEALDRATDEVALILAHGGPIQYLGRAGWQATPPTSDVRRDTLSSTHHESGTLWMGDDPATSVTDVWGRLHESDNLHAVGPSVLPAIGSPNPMLSGVALARRTADHIVPVPQPAAPEAGFRHLFDGTDRTFSLWRGVGGGAFALVDGAIVTQPGGNELGLLYYARQNFSDFVLRLQLRIGAVSDNSGIFVRFRDPKQPVPDRADPTHLIPYNNQHWVAVDTGFEIQIDETAAPDGQDQHRTGAVYGIAVPGGQAYQRPAPLVPGQWTDCQIEVRGSTYTVHLGGAQSTLFTNPDTWRGKPAATDPASGFIGLQAHTGEVGFRNIRIKEL
ncbi:family 16 glycoside hydrolase [Streptomyces sp. NPDC046197]|uniref:family 16 glycoside hydrolase n=1 Tax=Streptomyces sp. NPDC046197 TaxID=3154337 RepID=UPI0033EDB7B1